MRSPYMRLAVDARAVVATSLHRRRGCPRMRVEPAVEAISAQPGVISTGVGRASHMRPTPGAGRAAGTRAPTPPITLRWSGAWPRSQRVVAAAVFVGRLGPDRER